MVDATATVSDTRPYPVGMYVRFTKPTAMNQQLIYESGNRYAVVLPLRREVYAFQIADLLNTAATRFSARLTGSGVITAGTPTTLVRAARAADQTVLVPSQAGAGNYRFELNATNPDAPVLTITRQ